MTASHLLVHGALPTLFLFTDFTNLSLELNSFRWCTICCLLSLGSVGRKTNPCTFVAHDDQSDSDGRFIVPLRRSFVIRPLWGFRRGAFPRENPSPSDLLKSVSVSCSSHSRELIIHHCAPTSGHEQHQWCVSGTLGWVMAQTLWMTFGTRADWLPLLIWMSRNMDPGIWIMDVITALIPYRTQRDGFSLLNVRTIAMIHRRRRRRGRPDTTSLNLRGELKSVNILICFSLRNI